MRIIGLDVGEKRIGVAISDPLQITAQGLTTLKAGNNSDPLAELDQIVDQQEVSRIVVGLPLHLNGSDTEQTAKVRRFSEKLQKRFKKRAEVIFWDERLSSQEAERSMIAGDLSRRKRRGLIDRTAAVLILQGYLDSL